MLGFEKIKFSKNKYSKFLEKNRVFDNYTVFLELHEKEFLKKINKKKLPLLIRENYIIKKKEEKIYNEKHIFEKKENRNYEEKILELEKVEENKIQKIEEEVSDDNKDKNYDIQGDEKEEEKLETIELKEENIEIEESKEEENIEIEESKEEENIQIEESKEEENIQNEESKEEENIKTDESKEEENIKTDESEEKTPTKKTKDSDSEDEKLEQEFEKKKLLEKLQEKTFLKNTSKKPKTPLKTPKPEEPPLILKLCFLVHGLEASSHDLRNIRSILYQYFPKVVFILSEENEDDTKQNISTMGKRLAKEIKNYINYYEEHNNLEISFIGHSLGGLIIRASLEFLENYKEKFKSFITICSPHLGSSSKNFLVSTGIKFLSKFKQYKSLREMCLDDKEKYLVELSRKKNLRYFENVILIYAYYDGYVNYESGKVLFDNPLVKKEINREMVRNFYRNMDFSNLVKIGFFVPNVNKGFGYFIGRDAHIEILDNLFLGRLIFSQLKNYL